VDQPTSEPRTTDLRLAGFLATACALATLWMGSLVFARALFVPGAVAELIVRNTPGDVATFFIELLQHWALRLLTAAAVAGCLLVGTQAFVATARGSKPRPYFTGGLLAAASGLVLLAEPDGLAPLPALAVLAAAALVYGRAAAGIFRLASTADTQVDGGRRRALGVGIAWTAALVVGGGALGWLVRRVASPNTDVPLAAPDVPARVPERAGWPGVEGLTPEVTSPAEHYVVDINLYRPSIEVSDWTLEVKGKVRNRLALSFAELQKRFEIVEEYAVLTCVSNEVGGPLVGHSLWGGVRLGDVLDAAGAAPGAVDIVFGAADGYSDSIPADLARDPSVILAMAQNRRPLTRDHGFPCRLRVPPIYGMKNVKWITSIEVVGSDYLGYWQQRGWSDRATVRTQSRIDTAGEMFSAAVGTPTWVAGVAWAGDRGISMVEVSTDGGETWSEARLREPIGPLSWRQWLYRWTPEQAGAAVVMCRATDGVGATQTAHSAPPHPAGATGRHEVTVEVA
jgi:DMSO/TMAO reductase YedYZ molybdopterin-dependent catalytic subunit